MTSASRSKGEDVAAVAAGLLALADRVDALQASENALDVLIEIALFEPDECELGIRSNSAGTKIIYTIAGGRDRTCWAGDWTLGWATRRQTAATLRARAHLTDQEGQNR